VVELVAVMKLSVIRVTIDPHFVKDLQPAVAESAQGIGVTLALLTMMLVVTHLSLLGGSTTREAAPGLHRGQKVCPTRVMF